MDLIFLQGRSCLENAIFTIVNYYKRDYHLLLANIINLEVDEQLDKYKHISEAIPINDVYLFDYLEQYCYIKTKKFDVINDCDFDDLLYELEKRRPVLIDVDTFYCPHLKEQYMKYHIRHVVLGLNQDEHTIYFVDPTIGPYEYKMNKNEFKMAVKGGIYFYDMVNSNIEKQFENIEQTESKIIVSSNNYLLDLKPFYNNNGCSYEINDKSDLTMRGQYFLDKSIPGKMVVEYEDIQFQFPDITSTFDNISCEGQIINIKKGIYNKLYILGCCENGSFFDYVELYNENKFVGKVKIELSSWLNYTLCSDEKILFSFSTYDRSSKLFKESKQNLYVYMQTINFSGYIDAIKMPNCENMHIFAITLT